MTKFYETVLAVLKQDNRFFRVCQVKCVSSFLHLFPQPSAV